MHRWGGVVYRRKVSDVRKTTFFGDDDHPYEYLYPYDYDPDFAELSMSYAR